MYLRILKKDLKRKKTMNLILLIFIILATTFIASSVNNMVSISTALDYFFEKAEVPDYWFGTVDKEEAKRFDSFANKYHYQYKAQKLIQIEPQNIKINDKKFEYSNSLCLSQLKDSTNIFDSQDKKISEINSGEIYITKNVFQTSKNKFQTGDTIKITANGKTKAFTLKGYTKDALFGSPMMGIARFMVSQNDYEYFNTENASIFYSRAVYTNKKDFKDKLNALQLNTAFHIDYGGIKNTYLMDTIIAAVLFVVSVCLILISMLILRFTIHFTMSEEFREIGVMKAIGIGNREIRGLYITKYLAISSLGGFIGLILSVPFGKALIGIISQNIIITSHENFFLNIVCTFIVISVVVLFCYFCTRKIKKFSPIDAIRNGENGERYNRKGFLHLSKSRFSPVSYMALNDILSGMKRFAAMILIFTLGILLIIIPLNTINTLQSDHLITWFNMAECDHVISLEQIFNPSNNNRSSSEKQLKEIQSKLLKKGIRADVFQEIMFTMHISCQGKTTSSLAFQGIGDITTEQYVYLKGTAPQNTDEVGISHIIADTINANIGDTVTIKNGKTTKKYIVTAIYQTMNNMGEGIRFYQKEKLDYHYASGSFGIQILYRDNPDTKELNNRKEILKNILPEGKVHTAGSYVNSMIGEIAGKQLQMIKNLILIVVLCINILVTVLMVKSFIAKEKGEIAMLKAIGFNNTSLIAWQTLRIGIILFLSTILAILLSTPLSELSVEPIFKIMGAQSIQFEIVPLEVFVIYPLIVLGVTVLASALAALRICNITAAETANIE